MTHRHTIISTIVILLMILSTGAPARILCGCRDTARSGEPCAMTAETGCEGCGHTGAPAPSSTSSSGCCSPGDAPPADRAGVAGAPDMEQIACHCLGPLPAPTSSLADAVRPGSERQLDLDLFAISQLVVATFERIPDPRRVLRAPGELVPPPGSPPIFLRHASLLI